MSYKKTLDLLSDSIFSFDLSHEKEMNDLLTIETQKNINIYQKNLFGGILRNFSADFIVVKKYLGDRNFSFFVRKYILENKINTLSFIEMQKGFPSFLEGHFEIHQDEFVAHLAALDFLWAHGLEESEVIVPKGMALFWSHIEQGEDTSEITVSFLTNEVVKLHIKEGEKTIISRSEIS